MAATVYKNDAVRELLTGLNETLPEGKKVSVDKAVDGLAALGAGVEAVAKELSFEEIRDAAGVGLPIARAIAKIWRPEEPKPVENTSKTPQVQLGGFSGGVGELALALGNYQALPDKVLILGYHPLQQPAIAAELKKRAGDVPFIVFTDKKALIVNVEATEANLNQTRLGIAFGDRVSVDGVMVRVYRVGEMPDAAYEICPVHEVHLVGPDQYCPICQRTWKDVPEGVRHLVYVQTQDVWGEAPPANDPRLQQMFLTLGQAKDPYWASAELELERYRNTGRVIVLVKPPEQSRTRR